MLLYAEVLDTGAKDASDGGFTECADDVDAMTASIAGKDTAAQCGCTKDEAGSVSVSAAANDGRARYTTLGMLLCIVC